MPGRDDANRSLPPVRRADGAIGKAIETEAFPMLIAECK